MIKEMAQIAAECVRTPGRKSIWSPKLGAGLQEPGCVGVPEFVRRDLLYSKLAA
jgi:hypothetical protein